MLGHPLVHPGVGNRVSDLVLGKQEITRLNRADRRLPTPGVSGECEYAAEPVVTDFGIALALSAAGGGRMTETGLSLGTPHYMSPEQATTDRDLSARSDVYSLACVLYEMLAGDPPHIGRTAQAILMRILTEEPSSVTDVRKAVPPHVQAVLVKALEKLPADRFESAEQFAAALDNEHHQRKQSAHAS